jgi:hypothetical protein
VAIGVLVLAAGALAQSFERVTETVQLGGYVGTTGDGHGPGVACGDYDRDGWPDLYFVEEEGSPGHLYQNVALAGGIRGFARRTGLGTDDLGPGTGAVFADYDNDGDLDLYVTNFGAPNSLRRNLLAETGVALFEDVTAEAGVGVATDAGGEQLLLTLVACFADVNRDGWLDLFVGNHNGFFGDQSGLKPGQRDVLYLNQGDGSFFDVSEAAGVPGWLSPTGKADTVYQRFSSTNAAIFVDLNQDRWPDLYVTNKVGGPLDRDAVYLNRGSTAAGVWAGFEEVSYRLGIGHVSGAAMGVDAGDYDADGDLDLYITDFGITGEPGFNDLWTNQLVDRGGAFTLHLDAQAEGAFSWGTWFGDVDNDGDVDLHVATNVGERDLLYRNDGGAFTEVAVQAGVGQSRDSRGNIWLDYDRDGWLDFLVINLYEAPTLYRNTTADYSAAHWLGLDLEGDPTLDGELASSVDAVGTRVEVRGDFDADGVLEPEERAVRELTRGGSNCASNHDPDLHFGVGAATSVDVTIDWAGGGREVLANQAVDQRLSLREGVRPADGRAPTLSWVQPSPGDQVRESQVLLDVVAHDDQRIEQVQFCVDGEPLDRDVLALPVASFDHYQVQWPTAAHDFGRRTLTAVAIDVSGNRTEASIEVGLDHSVKSSLLLDVARFDEQVIGPTAGEVFPAGLEFHDELRDVSLTYGSGAVPPRFYFLMNDAAELFGPDQELRLAGRMAQLDPRNHLSGFGVAVMRDPFAHEDDVLHFWLLYSAQGGVNQLAAVAFAPALSSEPIAVLALDPSLRTDPFELRLVRIADLLQFELTHPQSGAHFRVAQIHGPSAGLDLDGFGRAGISLAGEAFADASQVVHKTTRFELQELTRRAPAFGESCFDLFGNLPQIGLIDAPRLGNSEFAAVLYGVPAGTLGVLMIGSSNTHQDGLPILPLDLTTSGAPGCSLLVSLDQFAAAVAVGQSVHDGVAEIPLPIASDPALAGVPFYLQWALRQPGVNTLNYVLTSAVEVVPLP